MLTRRKEETGGGYIGGRVGSDYGAGFNTGGTQTEGGRGNDYNGGMPGSFGMGASTNPYSSYAGGGGGGLYGGGSGTNFRNGTNNYGYGGGGGSGYFSTNISNGCMYSYNTSFTSSVVATKTISTSNVSSSAIAGYAKEGNGYARITLVE